MQQDCQQEHMRLKIHGKCLAENLAHGKSSKHVPWSESAHSVSRSHHEEQRRNRCGALWKVWGVIKKWGNKKGCERASLGPRGLGIPFSSWICSLHTITANYFTKFKKSVTRLMAGRMRNWMKWSAPQECLAQSPYFQNFPVWQVWDCAVTESLAKEIQC